MNVRPGVRDIAVRSCTRVDARNRPTIRKGTAVALPSRTMKRIVLAVLFSDAVAACSGSSAPATDDAGASGDAAAAGDDAATVMGTVAGKPFTPVDTIALKGVYDPSYPGIVTIVMGNMPNLCALFQQLAGLPGSHAAKANLVELGFTLGDTTSTSTVVVGTYTPSSSPNLLDSAGWDSYDGTCSATHSGGTSSATVTLNSVGAVYAGTFDMTFTDGNRISGSFSAPLCSIPLPDAGSGTSGDGGTVCLP